MRSRYQSSVSSLNTPADSIIRAAGAKLALLVLLKSFDLRQHFVDDGISASAVALQRIS